MLEQPITPNRTLRIHVNALLTTEFSCVAEEDSAVDNADGRSIGRNSTCG